MLSKEGSARSVKFSFIIAAVFLAGAASLLYEVLWVRQLGLSLGSTAVATSVMLSAFLGGLALGSWFMGKRADKMKSPLRTLAYVEVVAAILGILSIPALAYAGHAYVLVATWLGANGFEGLLLRSLFSFLVMLIPAVVFGATFPLATVAGGRVIDPQIAVGAVSAASSFGSAIGAALCGLFLEPALGLFGSALVGAAFNLLAASFAFLAMKFSRSEKSL